MHTYSTIFLLFLTLTAHTQISFDASKISRQTAKIVRKIEKVNVVMSDAVGFSGERPGQWDQFVRLESNATTAELTELTSHPSPAVRCYAFWALSHNHTVDLYPIIIRHIHDYAHVQTLFGCVGSYEYVGDFFIELVTPGYGNLDSKKLDSAQFAILDSILIFTPNDLSAKTGAINRAQPTEQLYLLLRGLVLRDSNQDALVKLAKYQKEQDIDLILNNRPPAKTEASDFFYTYKAISQFPHLDFLPLLEKNLRETLDNDHFNNEWRELYNAIACYKSKKALELLQIPFTQVKHKNIRTYHIDFVFRALQSIKDTLYDDMLWKLWEEEDRVSTDVFEHLYNKNPDRAFELAKKNLQEVDKLHRANISLNMFEVDASENLTAAMLDLILNRDRELGLEMIRNNIRDASVTLFPVFSAKAIEIKDPSFIEPLLVRFETDANPHIYLKAATGLIAYNDAAINRRILETSNKIEHLKSGWGGRALDKLLNDNHLN